MTGNDLILLKVINPMINYRPDKNCKIYLGISHVRDTDDTSILAEAGVSSS